MDRREFMAATIGFFGCTLLKLEASEDKPIIYPPKLFVRQTEGSPVAGADVPPGFFYLAQEETNTAIVLGREIEVEVIDYREKVGIVGNKGEKLEQFVCYDVNDPIFKEIKEKSRQKGVRAHSYIDEQQRICYWEVESFIRIGKYEARIGHRGKIGLEFVVNVPVGSKAVYGVTDVEGSNGPRYFRLLKSVNGKPVQTDPGTNMRYV